MPLLLEKVYVVVGLLLVPDTVEPALVLVKGLLLLPCDVLLLCLLVLPQSLEFVLVALLVEIAL